MLRDRCYATAPESKALPLETLRCTSSLIISITLAAVISSFPFFAAIGLLYKCIYCVHSIAGTEVFHRHYRTRQQFSIVKKTAIGFICFNGVYRLAGATARNSIMPSFHLFLLCYRNFVSPANESIVWSYDCRLGALQSRYTSILAEMLGFSCSFQG